MLYRLHFGRAPCWSVRRSDPDETHLPSLPGWAVFNPAVAWKDSAWTPPTFLTCDAERALVYASEMVFRVAPSESEITPERMLPIVKWIRFASGQSTVSDVLGGQFLDDSLIGPRLDFFPADASAMTVMPHVELTAISHELLRTRAEAAQSPDVPVYADILLDAIESDFSGDYMKAVLYSAIAVECVAAARLDEEFRRTSMSSGDDPRYAALRKRARMSFRTLLHDLPQYVLKRSLLREEPALHQAILELRETRNRFVHAGTSPDPVQAYDLAKASFATALQAFAWFRADGRFVTKHNQAYRAR